MELFHGSTCGISTATWKIYTRLMVVPRALAKMLYRTILTPEFVSTDGSWKKADMMLLFDHLLLWSRF